MNELRVKRGDTLQLTSTWADEAGLALDLTGVSAIFTARLVSDQTAAISGSTTDGELVVDAQAGSITLTIAADVMADVAPGNYLAEIETTWPDATVLSTDSWRLVIVEDLTVPGVPAP